MSCDTKEHKEHRENKELSASSFDGEAHEYDLHGMSTAELARALSIDVQQTDTVSLSSECQAIDEPLDPLAIASDHTARKSPQKMRIISEFALGVLEVDPTHVLVQKRWRLQNRGLVPWTHSSLRIVALNVASANVITTSLPVLCKPLEVTEIGLKVRLPRAEDIRRYYFRLAVLDRRSSDTHEELRPVAFGDKMELIVTPTQIKSHVQLLDTWKVFLTLKLTLQPSVHAHVPNVSTLPQFRLYMRPFVDKWATKRLPHDDLLTYMVDTWLTKTEEQNIRDNGSERG